MHVDYVVAFALVNFPRRTCCLYVLRPSPWRFYRGGWRRSIRKHWLSHLATVMQYTRGVKWHSSGDLQINVCVLVGSAVEREICNALGERYHNNMRDPGSMAIRQWLLFPAHRWIANAGGPGAQQYFLYGDPDVVGTQGQRHQAGTGSVLYRTAECRGFLTRIYCPVTFVINNFIKEPKNCQMKSIIPTLSCALFSVFLSASSSVLAWDGAYSGKVTRIDITSATNYGLRVWLADVPSMCNGGQNWAFLNETDSNYKTYLAAILLAKAQGSSLTVYSTQEGGFCRIGYLSLS